MNTQAKLDPRDGRRVVALILSGIFPGLGQFYNRHLLKGAQFQSVSVNRTTAEGKR